MSFAKLIDRFRVGFAAPTSTQPRHPPLQLAVAAVLLEIAYADGNFKPAEDGDVVGYLKNAFSLDDDSVRELMRVADEIRTRTIDYFSLTSFIKGQTSLEDRIAIVKEMWRIVYVDGRLSDNENYLVRKLADLLGLEHHVMIGAKVAVLEELGRPG